MTTGCLGEPVYALEVPGKYATRVRVEPRSCDQGCRKNEAFTLLATLPTIYYALLKLILM